MAPHPSPVGPQPLQRPRRGLLTLTPTLTVSEESKDNLLPDNRDECWDVVTAFIPGRALQWEQPTARR